MHAIHLTLEEKSSYKILAKTLTQAQTIYIRKRAININDHRKLVLANINGDTFLNILPYTCRSNKHGHLWLHWKSFFLFWKSLFSTRTYRWFRKKGKEEIPELLIEFKLRKPNLLKHISAHFCNIHIWVINILVAIQSACKHATHMVFFSLKFPFRWNSVK